ncbi:MAG: hypothetical protein WB493_00190 [Anaeromyxobacteraceae bacterium]
MPPLRVGVRVQALLLVGLVGGYTLLHLLATWATPLGSVPVLDAAENVGIARMLADGTFPSEPYYRAMLYPAVLAAMLRAGVPVASLPVAGGLLGLACHVITTLLVFLAARIVWRTSSGTGPAWVAALLFGLNPVAVFQAGELLDTTLALCLSMAGVFGTLAALDGASPRARNGSSITAGVAFGFATLARPHHAAFLVAAPVLLAVVSPAARRSAAFLGAAAVAVLLAGATVQAAHVGHFSVLPWQGAYNLWAANKPSANGRYYAQEVATFGVGEQRNPARVESELLYSRETGLPPTDVAAMNAHWRARFWGHVWGHPVDWAALVARKTYYFLNDQEQYNNKTFSFQKSIHPWLRRNPLHWGFTLILAAAGGALLASWKERRSVALLLGGLVIAYSAGAILYFPSDRFRLPLLPIACLAAGGVVRVGALRSAGRGTLVATGLAALVAGLVAYSGFLGVKDDSTIVTDRILLANAAVRSGDDDLAARTARPLLTDPLVGPQAFRIFLDAYVNVRMDPGWRAHEASLGDWEVLDGLSADPGEMARTQGFAWGVYLWNRGRRDEAIASWRIAGARPSEAGAANALACLVLTGTLSPAEEAILGEYFSGRAAMTPVLHSALTSRITPERLRPPEAELVRMYERLLGLTGP